MWLVSLWWQLGHEVDSTEGAGLDLDPETQGMRVTKAWKHKSGGWWWMCLIVFCRAKWSCILILQLLEVWMRCLDSMNEFLMRCLPAWNYVFSVLREPLEVYDKPGQPGLYERDLITKIDEAPLRGETKDQAEQNVSRELSIDAKMMQNLERRTDLFSSCSGFCYIPCRNAEHVFVGTPCCVQVEAIFGKNFRDGVLLTIKRESWSIQKK